MSDTNQRDDDDVEELVPEKTVSRSTEAPAPAVAASNGGEQQKSIVSQAIDKTTEESCAHIDRLITELNAMKAFIREDAERIKAEMEQHIAVRKTAGDLTDRVKGEMGIINNRMQSRT